MTVNGRTVEKRIGDLIGYSFNYPVGVTNSPSFKIHQVVPETQFRLNGTIEDEYEGNAFYHMEIFQKNGSLALISPVYFS